MSREKKLSLLQQAQIEQKRRQSKIFVAPYDPTVLNTVLMKSLLPEYTFIPKQEEYINARQLVTWLLGGYKSGKSFVGIDVDVLLAFVNRPIPGILVHPTMDGNTITILPLIEEICDLNKILHTVKKLSTKYIVTFKFGSQEKDWGKLILASGDIPRSLKGPKLAFGHIDEPLIMPEEIFNVILTRLAHINAKYRRLQLTGTPEPLHMKWGFDIVDKVRENSPGRFIETISAREVKKYLPPNYIEDNEANMTPEEALTFIDGLYRNLAGGRVYPNFNRDNNTFNPLNFNFDFSVVPFRELVLNYDFNVAHMSAGVQELAGRYKFKHREFRISSRSDTRELTLMAIDSMIQEKYLVLKNDRHYWSMFGTSLIISGDASGESGSSKSRKSDYMQIMEILEEKKVMYTFVVPQKNPPVRERTNYIDTEFYNKRYFISEKCPVAIRDRELMVWKKGAEGFFIDKSKPDISHMGEADDYGLWNTRVLTDGEHDDSSGNIEFQYRERRR